MKLPQLFQVIRNNKKLIYPLVFCSLLFNFIAALLEGTTFGSLLIGFHAVTGQIPDKWLRFFPASALNYFALHSNLHIFALFTAIAVLAQILRSACALLGRLSLEKTKIAIQQGVEKKVYSQILNFSYGFVHRYNIGELVDFVNIPSNIFNLFAQAIQLLLLAVMISLVSIGFMATLSLKLTFLFIFSSTLFFLLQKMLIKKMARHSSSYSNAILDFNKLGVQNITALRLVHTYAQNNTVLQKIDKLLEKIKEKNKHLSLMQGLIQFISEIGGITLVGCILLAGTFLLRHQQETALPMLLTFLGIAYRLSTKVQDIVWSCTTLAFHHGSLLRLENILRSDDKEYIESGSKKITSFESAITLKKTSLIYSGATTPSVDSVDLTIKKGNTIALVGKSGAGKSSITDLIIGLYQPTGGEIIVDDTPLKKLSLSSWRSLLGVVSQDTFIFNDTIANNIAFRSKNATMDEIKLAADKAHLLEFIDSLPEGFDTLVGEKGYRLSGGERQRLSIARALLHNPEILIFDEATSSLDTVSERIIQEAVENFKNEKTILLIAHRLSTVIHADEICYIEKGKILERGSHEELIAQKGAYYFLWQQQSQKPLEIEEADLSQV